MDNTYLSRGSVRDLGATEEERGEPRYALKTDAGRGIKRGGVNMKTHRCHQTRDVACPLRWRVQGTGGEVLSFTPVYGLKKGKVKKNGRKVRARW